MQKRIFVFIFYCTAFLINLYSSEMIYPDGFNAKKEYPMIFLKQDLFGPDEIKSYCNQNKVVIRLFNRIGNADEIEKDVSGKSIDKNRVYFVSSGLEGFAVLYRCPYFFASGVILLDTSETDGLIQLLKNDGVLAVNVKNMEKITFIPDAREKISEELLEELEDIIDDKGFPIRIRNTDSARIDKVLDLCAGKTDRRIRKIDFRTDTLDFNQARWLKIIKKSGIHAGIRAEINNNELSLTPFNADGLLIDLNYPEFDDLNESGEEMTIRINDKICFYGPIPLSKKLYLLYSVIAATNLDIAGALAAQAGIREEAYEPALPVKNDIRDIAEKTAAPVTETVKQSDIKSWTAPEKFIPGKEKVVINFDDIRGTIKNWNVDVSLTSGEVFKSFSGEDKPVPKLEWDGKGDAGDLLPNGVDCSYRLKYRDKNGDTFETASFKLETKLDVVRQDENRTLLIRFTDILFKKNVSALDAEAKKILNKAAEVISQNKSRIEKVDIDGHTDDSGPKQYNLKLSEKRSESVLGFLSDTKILKPGVYRARGYGDAAPLFPNDSDQNRKKNRRVEILIKLR